MSSLANCLVAGSLASLAAVLVFFVVHHLWIKPIWFVAPAGVPMALVGGLAVGWSYFHLQAALPPMPWTSPAVLGLILAILLPSALLSVTHGPLVDVETAAIPAGQGKRVALHVCLELLLTATVMGAVLGWRLGGTTMATVATAMAGLACAIGPGHNIPFFGTHPVALKGFALVLIVSVVAAISLPGALGLLERLRPA